MTNEAAFAEAIDRTVQFFVKPLFLEEYTEKELNAVNSEFEADLVSDEWRQYSVLSHLASKESYWKDFSIGNKETLQKPGVRPALLKFWQETYSANLMTAFVYGKASLEALQAIAEPLLLQIPDKQLKRINYKKLPAPFGAGNCRKLIR